MCSTPPAPHHNSERMASSGLKAEVSIKVKFPYFNQSSVKGYTLGYEVYKLGYGVIWGPKNCGKTMVKSILLESPRTGTSLPSDRYKI